VTVESGAPTSDACGGAGTAEDRGGCDEDVCGRRGGFLAGGAGLMPGTLVYRRW
jgi:hypothetical protein